MLEHKRNKLNTVNYPEGIDEMSKQRFKPKFVNEDTDAAYMITQRNICRSSACHARDHLQAVSRRQRCG